MTKTVKIGIIGCDSVCRHHHVAAYTDDLRAEVVALCDVKPEKAEFLKSNFFPNAVIYTDYKEMLKDGSIDAVDICTPNFLHAPISVAAMRAGKHVFCEKPDAINVDEVLEMKRVSEETGKLLMIMRNNRFVTASQYAKKYVESGKMGEIYAGRCGWQRRRGIPAKSGWFSDRSRSGGGPLIDLGVHMIDLAIWLMGDPTPVAVSGNTFRKFGDDSKGTFDVEDLAMGLIRFDNGAVLQFECSWASNIKEDDRFVELRGTESGLKWENDTLEIYTEEDGQLLDIAPVGKLDVLGRKNNIIHFIDVLTKGEKPVFEPQQGVDMIRLLNAVYESAETGHEVRL